MSEVLYEQYKDALRRGHMAALRGRLLLRQLPGRVKAGNNEQQE